MVNPEHTSQPEIKMDKGNAVEKRIPALRASDQGSEGGSVSGGITEGSGLIPLDPSSSRIPAIVKAKKESTSHLPLPNKESQTQPPVRRSGTSSLPLPKRDSLGSSQVLPVVNRNEQSHLPIPKRESLPSQVSSSVNRNELSHLPIPKRDSQPPQSLPVVNRNDSSVPPLKKAVPASQSSLPSPSKSVSSLPPLGSNHSNEKPASSKSAGMSKPLIVPPLSEDSVPPKPGSVSKPLSAMASDDKPLPPKPGSVSKPLSAMASDDKPLPPKPGSVSKPLNAMASDDKPLPPKPGSVSKPLSAVQSADADEKHASASEKDAAEVKDEKASAELLERKEKQSESVDEGEASLDSDSELSDEDASNADVNVSVAGLAIGSVIQDRYTIVSVIGDGGFATVYRAHDETNHRDVALKVMDLKKGIDANYTERFFREARIASQIQHENVVSIYDFGRIDKTGQPYIAMELLCGRTLNEELLEKGPLSPKRAFSLFRPVLEALAEGHRLGIVHKDLKPENLYLVSPDTPDEILKILDFGVARVQNEATRLTSDGLIFGTPRYLAPEYIRSQMVSPAVDVYQIALIFSEVLTGVPAVDGEPYQVMMMHCAGELRIADCLLDGKVGEVFRKALSIHPEDRYQNCETFKTAFDGIAEFFTSDEPIKNGKLLGLAQPPENAAGDASASNWNMPGVARISDRYMSAAEPIIVESAPSWRKIVIFAFVAMVIFGCAFAAFTALFTAEKTAPDAASVSEVVPSVVEFSFFTTPPGATVKRSGTFYVCSPTPCKAKFNESDLNLAQVIDFELDDYDVAHYELKKSTFEETHGEIHVQLNGSKKEVPSNELVFNLIYEPGNATVVEVESGNTVCTKSPCSYVFDIERGYVELLIKADGYQEMKETLAKRRFDDTNGVIHVSLTKSRRGQKGNKRQQKDDAPLEEYWAQQQKATESQMDVDVDALCKQAAKAKVSGDRCRAYRLYVRVKNAGVADPQCLRNAEATIEQFGWECQK